MTENCARCAQPRPCFDSKPEWGRVPARLCSPCWTRYADARASRSYVDWNDAFDNASDEELSDGLSGRHVVHVEASPATTNNRQESTG